MAKLKNIVIFLNGDRGAKALTRLVEKECNLGVVVVPETWKGNIGKLPCPVLRSNSVNSEEFLNHLRELKSDLFIVAGFSTIFKRELLSIPRLGVINFHGGALPKYRGGSPLNWQIINDEREIGLNIIQMDEGIDTGPILAERKFPLADSDDIKSVHERANIVFTEMLDEVIQNYENGNLKKIPQTGPASYWLQRIKLEGRIHWREMNAREVFNLVRALSPPYPGAFTTCDGNNISITKATETKMEIRGMPGRVAYIQGKGPYVVCKDRAILIEESSQKLLNGTFLE